MRVLLTRPEADSRPLAERLAKLGHDCLISPLMEIANAPDATLQFDGVQALLATSSNGVRALAGRNDAAALRRLPLFAVGDATARTARAAGFAEVHVAGGDVDKLATLVAKSLKPAGGRLVHAAGRERAGDLKAALAAHGFAVDVAVLYSAETARALAPEAEAALRADLIDAVLLYSPRTARIFADLVIAAGLTEQARRLHFLCLSAAVAEALAPLGPEGARVRVARLPEQEALLALIDKVSGAR